MEYDWRTDKQFLKWNSKLCHDKFTFENAIEFIGIDKWEFETEDWKKIAKDIFTPLAERWNSSTGREEKDGEILAFAAITLCYVSIPYHLLKKADISELMAQMIIRVVFYEYNMCTDIERTIPMPEETLHIEVEENLRGGPMHPGAYTEWINDLYNSASWWLSFLIYNKAHNLGIDGSDLILLEKFEK